MLLERKEPIESHVYKLGNMGSVNMHFYLYRCFIVNTRSIIKFASENGSNTQLPLYLHSYISRYFQSLISLLLNWPIQPYILTWISFALSSFVSSPFVLQSQNLFKGNIHFCTNMCRIHSSVKDDSLCSDQGKGIKLFTSVWTMCPNFY